jgi:ribosome-binding factor A
MTHRIARLSAEIQKEISEILMHDMHDPRIGLVSVVAVTLAPDLSSARIYISPLADQDHAEVIEGISSAKGFIRRLLGQRVKMRVVPELIFRIDDSIAYGSKMLTVINEQIEKDEAAAVLRPPEEDNL